MGVLREFYGSFTGVLREFYGSSKWVFQESNLICAETININKFTLINLL